MKLMELIMSKDNEPTIINIAEQIIKLEKNKAAIEETIKDIYHEAKSIGYDQKILKRAIRFVTMEEKDRKRFKIENDMFEVYVQQMNLPL
jgi:uncharacterized protein (UPF0335 family)